MLKLKSRALNLELELAWCCCWSCSWSWDWIGGFELGVELGELCYLPTMRTQNSTRGFEHHETAKVVSTSILNDLTTLASRSSENGAIFCEIGN